MSATDDIGPFAGPIVAADLYTSVALGTVDVDVVARRMSARIRPEEVHTIEYAPQRKTDVVNLARACARAARFDDYFPGQLIYFPGEALRLAPTLSQMERGK